MTDTHPIFDVQSVVIGAGVVGLAVARALAEHGHEVLILERGSIFGEGVSARNSEVIHAGIYYPHGSLKARLCVRGRDMLYAYCRERSIAHAAVGKLIVAANEAQNATLQEIRAKANANGVSSVAWIPREEARALEPALHCVGALISPETGIIDGHALMLGFLTDAQAHGAVFCPRTPVLSLRRDQGLTLVECGGDAPCIVRARNVVNAAGLAAPGIASMLWSGAPRPPLKFARGNYFTLSGSRTPFSRLVYPVPEPGGLGVHFTLDIAGRGKFGPDVEWTDEETYDVNLSRAESFYARIREYWPDLPDGALAPDYVGIRPKLDAPEGIAADFMIAGPEIHGDAGVVHLLGIESPGLTASMAIAEMTAELIGRNPGGLERAVVPAAMPD